MTRKLASESCPQIVLDWIAWYPDGDLPADVRGAIEVHAAECAECRQEIVDLSGEGARQASVSDDSERVFARTLEKIAQQPHRRAPAAPHRRTWLVRPRFAVAAGLAVAVISGSVGVVATQQLGSEVTYRTAGNHESAPAPETAAHLDVVFRPDASYAQISRAIQALGGSLESGPSQGGVVHLRLARGADPAVAARRLESGDLHVAEFAQPAP
jgi:anti-sigma factor RsiW